MEVRVLCEGVPGLVAVKASGSVSERPEAADQRADVTTWRWIGSIKLVVSLVHRTGF
jgi:hypothetical protein